jgi:hypothetical protein
MGFSLIVSKREGQSSRRSVLAQKSHENDPAMQLGRIRYDHLE